MGAGRPVSFSRLAMKLYMRVLRASTTSGFSAATLWFSSGSLMRLYSSISGLKWKSGSSATMSFHSGVRQPCLRIQVHSVM